MITLNVNSARTAGGGTTYPSLLGLNDEPPKIKDDKSKDGPEQLRSGALLHLPGKTGIPMAMIIGQAEAKQDVEETIDFLKNPSAYAEMGARMPSGLLFEGGPGVGKTLMVKAIANTAGVPILSVNGSSFVQQYVGVGASRVRQLFSEARSHAPCIIFIDEIDTLGRARSASGDSGAHEYDQTLNALLAEMDGFDERNGVIVIGATNRKDMLDEALLRPKRFDRHVVFHNPTLQDRQALLGLYLAENIRERDLDLQQAARMTPGASGAIMENIANEAKIAAVRAGKKRMSNAILDEAVSKVTMGARRKGLMPSEHDIHVTAVHEGGHARVFHKLSGRAPLRFTIVPRGNSGGHVQFDQEGELYRTKEQFKIQLAVAMAGKAAVELYCKGQQDTGVSADLKMASKIALAMVAEYGMSGAGYLSLDAYSDRTLIPASVKKEIHAAANQLLTDALETARTILRDDSTAFLKLVETVKQKETILGSEFDALFSTANS